MAVPFEDRSGGRGPGWRRGDRARFIGDWLDYSGAEDLPYRALGTVIATSLYGQDVDVAFDTGEVVYGIHALDVTGP